MRKTQKGDKEMKKLNKKGFTLAELLIVVAIIAVLVAIAIPVFTSQLEKSREATDLANIRAAYAEASAALLTNGSEQETATTAAAVSTGAFETDTTSITWAKLPANVTKGTAFTVTVTSDGTTTIRQN